MNNKELIEAARKGDIKAFGRIVELNSQSAFRITFRIVANEEDARDIVQESFIVIWEKLDRIKDTTKFESWLYRVLVNKSYDLLREKKRRPGEMGQAEDRLRLISTEDDNPEKRLENQEIAGLIKHYSEGLSKKQRLVFVLSELEGKSHDEIAEITGIKKDSIKSNLHHARKKIMEKLKKEV